MFDMQAANGCVLACRISSEYKYELFIHAATMGAGSMIMNDSATQKLSESGSLTTYEVRFA